MDFSSINWLAVVACVVASMVVGTIWYNPKTFFNPWLAIVGNGKEQPGMEDMGMVWGLTVVASAVEAIGVSLLLNAMGWSGLTNGLLAAFWIWLGIVAPTNLVNKLFAGHGLKVWAIEAGGHLATLLAFGAIIGTWS